MRAAFVASQHAARLIVPCRRGLIVNVSQWAAQKYHGNVIYGVSKAATDKLTADMAVELSPEFIGRAVAALAGNQDVYRWTGQVLVAAALAEHYGFADIDGRSPRPLTLTDV